MVVDGTRVLLSLGTATNLFAWDLDDPNLDYINAGAFMKIAGVGSSEGDIATIMDNDEIIIRPSDDIPGLPGGPTTTVANQIPRFRDTVGNLGASLCTIDPSNNMGVIGHLTVGGIQVISNVGVISHANINPLIAGTGLTFTAGVLSVDGFATLGDVTGPGTHADNIVPTFNGVNTNTLQASAFTAVSGVMSGARFRYGNGLVGTPAISFTGYTGTGVYTTTGDFHIAVNGTLKLTVKGTQLVSTEPFVGPVGSAIAPTFVCTGETTTGWFNYGVGQMGFGSAGTTQAYFDQYGLALLGSTAISRPSLTFIGDTNSGIRHVGADHIQIVTGGDDHFGVNNSRIYMDSGHFFSVWGDASFYGIDMANDSAHHYGTVTAHSIKMNVASGAGRGFTWGVAGSTPIAGLTNAGDFQVAGWVRAEDGSAGAPTFSFNNDTNDGMFSRGTSQIGWAVNSVEEMYLTTTYLYTVGWVSATGITLRPRSAGSTITEGHLYYDSDINKLVVYVDTKGGTETVTSA